MKEKILKIILVILLILLFLVILSVNSLFKEKNENISKVDETEKVGSSSAIIYSSNLKKKVEFKNLIFSNVVLKYKDNKTEFFVDITNESGKDVGSVIFDVILKDKDENILGTLVGSVDVEISQGMTVTASVVMEHEFVGVYSYKFVEHNDNSNVTSEELESSNVIEE